MKGLTQSIWGLSILQAVGAGVVIWLWSIFMTNAEGLINLGPGPSVAGLIVVPIIFMTTAILAGGAVLGYPISLALQGQWGRAISLTALSLVWLGILATVLIYLF